MKLYRTYRHRFIPVWIILLSAVAMVLSCNTPTEQFERDNVRDPLNRNFDPGDPGSITFDSNERGIITVSWPDTIGYEDGYIIEKSLSDSVSYEEIGTVPANHSEFSDTSKTVRLNTFYRIRAFVKNGDREAEYVLFKGKLPLGSIKSSLTYDRTSRAVVLNWKDRSNFETEIRVERKIHGMENYVEIAFLDKNTTGYRDQLSPDIDFSGRYYRISMILKGEDFEEIIDTSINIFDTSYNLAPDKLTIEFENEEHVKLRWRDRCFFEEGYKIYKVNPQNFGDRELLATVEPDFTSYIHRQPLNYGSTYEYMVTAFKGNTNSANALNEKRFTIPTPELIYDRYSNPDSNSITLAWNISNDQLVTNFILEQAIGSGPWSEIGRFAKSEKSTTINNVNPENKNKFRIRTISSRYSDPLSLSYKYLAERVNRYKAHNNAISTMKFETNKNYLVTSSYFKSASGYSYGDSFVKIWDLSTLEPVRTINDVGYYVHNIELSSDGNYLAAATRSSNLYDDYGVKIFDIKDGSLIDSLSYPYAEDLAFSPDGSSLLVIKAYDGDVEQFDLSTDSTVTIHQGTGTYYYSYDFHTLERSQNNTYIAFDDQDVIVRDANTGSLVKSFNTSDRRNNTLTFDPTSSKFAFIDNEKLSIFRTSDWSLLTNFRASYNINYVHTTIDFNPLDNDLVAVAAYNRVLVYDTSQSQPSAISGFYTSDEIKSMRFMPDGKHFIVGVYGGYLELWKESSQQYWWQF